MHRVTEGTHENRLKQLVRQTHRKKEKCWDIARPKRENVLECAQDTHSVPNIITTQEGRKSLTLSLHRLSLF